MSTTIYVNGKRVTKDELKNIEIHSETIDRIFLEKLSHSSDNHENSNIIKAEYENH